jgi:CRP-like cAMP-binding protein
MWRPRPDVSVFAGAAPFAGYGAHELAPLVPHADRLVVLPGAALAEAGRRPHEVLVLLSGEAHLVGGPHDGAGLAPGALIGAREELTGGSHEATVVAGAGVAALVLTGPAFRWAVQSLPGLRGRLGLDQPAETSDAAAA